MFMGKIDPFLQTVLGYCGAGGIVWKTQINQINRRFGQRWNKTILRQAFQINDFIVSSIIEISGSAGHDIRIQINRIHRIRNRQANVRCKDFLNITRIAFGAVTDKNLI